MYAKRDITVIIPAFNEAPSIVRVIEELTALRACPECNQLVISADSDGNTVSGESVHCATATCHCENSSTQSDPLSEPLVDRIIVADNGSTDDTALLAAASGALVTYEPEKGYGAACLAALAVEVKKDIIVFVDGDHSVVATELPGLIIPLLTDADLVIGSRTLGHTEKGALTAPQQFGNSLASFLIRKLWSANVTDLGPFRAITQKTLDDLQMKDRKFGWTVEMQVRALQENKIVTEVPVSTLKRIGESKISGTIRGVIGAAHGILGTILKLYLFGSNHSTATKQSTSPNLRPGKN